MAIPFILAAREMHGVKSADDYLRRHAAFVARNAKRGARFQVHEDLTGSNPARIDAGRWVADCSCGNTCATDPAWGLACCFACGAIYRSVVFPEDRQAIEAILVERPHPMQRGWDIGETLADLIVENEGIGVAVPQDAIAAAKEGR